MELYTVHDYTVGIAAPEYISRFRDADRIIQYCRECPNVGRSLACPPFSHDTAEELNRFTDVLLIATRIEPRVSHPCVRRVLQ